MGLPSGARANARAFDRNQRKDQQGPEGPDRDRSPLGGGDPTVEERGLVESITDTLDEWSNDIQEALGGDAQDITVPTERPFDGAHRRNPNDEVRSPPPLKPPEEDEPIIPGDPNDLGARGRRRGTRDAVNASPVLRRGLLGV